MAPAHPGEVLPGERGGNQGDIRMIARALAGGDRMLEPGGFGQDDLFACLQ